MIYISLLKLYSDRGLVEAACIKLVKDVFLYEIEWQELRGTRFSVVVGFLLILNCNLLVNVSLVIKIYGNGFVLLFSYFYNKLYVKM